MALQETLLPAGAGRGHAQEVPAAGLHPPQAVCVHQRVPGYGTAEEGGLAEGVGVLALLRVCHRLQSLISLAFVLFFFFIFRALQFPVIV